MLKWQATYTPGFYDAMLSKFEHFPLGKDSLYELYFALGSHPSRPMLIITGANDALFGGTERHKALQACFKNKSCQIINFQPLGITFVSRASKTAAVLLTHVEEAAQLTRREQDGYDEF